VLIAKLSGQSKATVYMHLIRFYGSTQVCQLSPHLSLHDHVDSDVDQVQYLEWEDYQTYVKAITEFRDHIMNDPSYLRIFHQQHFVRRHSDTKNNQGKYSTFYCKPPA